jgi:serine/arginine repetitive matrix protein 2
MLTSPYGLPLPRPPPSYVTIPGKKKGSLQTKYERTNSATSSNFSIRSGESEPTPVSASALFAQFTRELPPTPPPKLATMATHSPFKLPNFQLSGKGDEQKSKEQEADETLEQAKRARVNSGARRQALGWGRRRNSDGPAKVSGERSSVTREVMGMKKLVFEDKESVKGDGIRPALSQGRSTILKGRENVPIIR